MTVGLNLFPGETIVRSPRYRIVPTPRELAPTLLNGVMEYQ